MRDGVALVSNLFSQLPWVNLFELPSGGDPYTIADKYFPTAPLPVMSDNHLVRSRQLPDRFFWEAREPYRQSAGGGNKMAWKKRYSFPMPDHTESKEMSVNETVNLIRIE